MVRKFELKKWLTIDEAAQLLSLSFSDSFDAQDVLYFVLDDRLSVYWGLRNVNAQEVALRNHLIGSDFASLLSEEFRRGPEWAKDSVWKLLFARVNDPTTHSYRARPDAILNGVYRLDLEYIPCLLDHLCHVPVNHENRDPGIERLVGTVVFDGIDRIYELLEPKKKSEGRDFYWPSFRVPELSELLFDREEVQEFARTCLMREVVSESQPSQKGRNAMLRTIEALADTLNGLTGKHHTDAEACLAAMESKKITPPIGKDALAKYLSEAKKLK